MHLNTTAAFLACYCSLNLSTLGKPLDPGTSFRVPPGYAGVMTRRLAAQGDLQQGVLEDLLDPVLVPDLVLGQPGPGTGQRPQIPDSFRRHERAAQHPPLVQLAQPHAVFPVGFAPAGQVLHVPGVDQPHLQASRLGVTTSTCSSATSAPSSPAADDAVSDPDAASFFVFFF